MPPASNRRTVLHIVTRTDDALAVEVIAAQRTQPELEVGAVDLTAPGPDYENLLEKIFAADSVSVW
jgi:hypothetical protein